MDFVSAKSIFAAVILLALFVYWIFNFLILYHLTRFGIGTQPKRFAAIFLLGSVTLFIISSLLFASVDINSLKSRFKKLEGNVFEIAYLK
jgi:hypothetical protein